MQKRKKILSGVSVATLIMAGSLPLMADQQKAKTCSCGKGSSAKAQKQTVKEAPATKAKATPSTAATKEVQKSKTAK
jgi:hypothetical protein